MAYTIKEINAVVGCTTFTAAAICSPSSLQLVQVWAKAFCNFDLLFAACKGVLSYLVSQLIETHIFAGTSLQTLGLNECVKIIVLGYFSIDKERKMEHFCFGPDEDRSNYICGDFNHIFQYLINHFSHPVSTILDLTEMQGICIFSLFLFLTHSSQ